MNKIVCNQNKILKLTNALKYKILIHNDNFDFKAVVEQMESYIRGKGSMQIGPLIQYTRTFLSDSNELNIEMVIIMQCSNYINKVEEPYSIESLLRVTNCMYCRYSGSKEKIKYAYDKLGVEAFEANIELTGESYTIFIDKDEENDEISADIFMPKKNI